MAKKNSNKKNVSLSPEKFLKEKANKLPIYKCYVSRDYQKTGEAMVIISRTRGNGKLCTASYLIDLWCMGIKDSYGNVNLEKDVFEDHIAKQGNILEEIDYTTVHNLIYGALEFAEEADIEPHFSFRTWKYLLAEDNDEIPLIEFEFGKDGKHFLVTEPGSPASMLIPRIKNKLGDRFDYILGGMEDDMLPYFDEEEWKEEERKRFHYDYPDYPSRLNLHHPYLGELLLSDTPSIPQKDLDKILSLPKEEVENDILQIVMWEIGDTYRKINSNPKFVPENSTLIHSLLLLAALESKNGFKAAMEILHQSDDFIESHLDIESTEFLIPAIKFSNPGEEEFKMLEDFLHEKGHCSNAYTVVGEALTTIAQESETEKKRVMDIFTRWIRKMPEYLEKGDWFNIEVPSFLICNLMDLGASELLPEIKVLFDAGFVDESICDDFNYVKGEMEMPHTIGFSPRYTHESILNLITR
ncbi:MAG: hypothetical protein K2H46_01710 [Muribaculaceae bacterium]|nr:hypothetical protein [Muribaculaceae bacterium]